MAQADPPAPGPGEPSSARIHNYLTGGWNFTAADQVKAAELEEICPPIRQMGADSRLFTARAVSWAAADAGICQFIDLGAGLPPGEAVHDMARAVRPGARVAYVDRDPEVCDFIRDVTLGGGRDGVAVLGADLRDPAAVMSDPGLRAVIDPAEPVCLVMAMVLHFVPGAPAQALIREYARHLAPGSLIAVSVPHMADEAMWRRLRPANPDFAWNHDRDDLERFLGGLDLVPPGVRAAFSLRPAQWEAAGCRKAAAYVLAGIGRKP